MKIKLSALVVLIGSTLFTLSLANAEMAAIPSTDKGRILHLEGMVQVKEPGETSWKTPKNGAWVKAGSEIRTGTASSCDIGLGEGRSSVLQMKENSQTKLQVLDASLIHVNLEAGSIFAKVRGLKKDSTFKVSSPTAIASVRGTGWEQSMEEINVFENSVEVAGINGETVLVEEGFGVDIDAKGDVKEPEPVSAEDKAEYENFETQAEQLVTEEAAAPDDSAFEGFGGDFGSEGLENPGESTGGESGEDVLGEAKEEQQENESGEESEEDCVPNTANFYSCA